MSTLAKDTVDLKCRIIKESEKAILIHLDDSYLIANDCDAPVTHLQWFPLSQVNKITRGATAGEDTINVSKWIVAKKGIEI